MSSAPQKVDLTGIADGSSARLAGWLARPAGEGPWPGVVVVHEAFGVDDVMLRATQRIADMGYLALLPDLFSDGGALRCLVSTMRALSSGQGRAYADIEAARQWLLRRDDCAGRVGVVGFCMGGGFAIMVAGRGFDVAAPNYGAAPKNLDDALRGSCAMVASYGGKDRAMAAVPGRLEETLTRLGVEHDVKTYPDAGHSFLNDAANGPRLMRPLMARMHVGPEPASAADAWGRIERFFAAHLR